MSTKTSKNISGSVSISMSTRRVDKILNKLRDKTLEELRSPRVEKGKK